MTNLEKLEALCKRQGRDISTQTHCGYQRLIVTESGIFGGIETSMGGTASLEEYAGLMLDLLEPKLRIIK